MTGPFPIIGFPDLAVLFRIDPELAEKNFTGLKAIFEAMVEEINGAAGSQLVCDELTRSGADIVNFNLFQFESRAPSLDISIGRREDVLFLTVGASLRDEVLSILDEPHPWTFSSMRASSSTWATA